MAIQGRTRDNRSRKVNEVFQCLVNTPTIAGQPAFRHFLEELGGRRLADLLNRNPRLLVFPQAFEMVKDDIGGSSIFHFDGESITTGNVMGFVGMEGVSLSISSRFYSEQNDYFLHYLLQRVVGFHAVDLPTPHGADPIWDFLPYLFPAQFMAAWKQGIFKSCRRFNANDDRIKGAIDIAQHIRSNIPFRGRIAYSFSERTLVTPINQLIRLTIDVLEHSVRFKAMFHGDNREFNDAIRDLKTMVPVEFIGNRSKIIKDNLRSVSHPLYLKYKPLQELCLAILRQKKMSFVGNEEDVVGLLFDGSWLWEEYLAKLMPPIFIHAKNKLGCGGYQPAKGGVWGNWMPDYYVKGSIVLDAKYKSPDKEESRRSDRHQIVAYMHTLKANCGGFIYPGEDAQQIQIGEPARLHGNGGTVYQLQMPIPSQAHSFNEFAQAMRNWEEELKERISNLAISP